MTVSDAGWLPGERRDNRRAAMQYGVLAERNCEGLLFGAEHRRVRCLRPHRGIIDEVALLPLRHRLRVEVVASGELFDRSLRSLYRSSDDVSGLGAAVKYLSHRASRNVGSDCLIPRHSGTTHLGRDLIKHAVRDVPISRRVCRSVQKELWGVLLSLFPL